MNQEREIKTISFGRACRERLGMYLSSDTREALHLGLREIYVNSFDALTESSTKDGIVNILINSNERSINVRDNGPGIPYKMREDGISSLVAALTMSHTGSHFDGREVNAIGLNGVGSAVVTNTSKVLIAINQDKKTKTHVHFKGSEQGAVLVIEEKLDGHPKISGLDITYVPDEEVYGEDTWFDFEELKEELSEMMKFYPNITLKLNFDGEEEKFHYPNGLKQKDTQLYYESDNVVISLSVGGGIIKPFGNRLYLPQGGNFFTHFKTCLTKEINNRANFKLSGPLIQSLFNGYVSILVVNPLFSNQSKTAISNKTCNSEITSAVKEIIEKFSQTKEWEKLIKKLEIEKKAEEAAQKARDKILGIQEKQKQQKVYADPDKFTDCSSKNRQDCEVFICEGLSAGSNLQLGRNPKTQAILRLRGKILNVIRANYIQAVENDVIQTLISSIGLEIGENGLKVDLRKIRFGKIVITADSDQDGAHISSLVLTFFWKFARELIEKGYIYIAEPYLYKITWGKDNYKFIKDEKELKQFQKTIKGKFTITRIKGLGECSAEELREMILSEERTIRQITMEDIQKAEKVFLLMSNMVEERREFLQDNDLS